MFWKKNSEMRIFDEITGERVIDPDLDAGVVNQAENMIESRYHLIEPAKISYETKKYPNGSTIDKSYIKPGDEEKGEWRQYDFRGGEEHDITDEIDYEVPETAAHDQVIPDVEHIGIYHTYTEEELEKMARDKEAQEEAMKQSAIKEAFISSIMLNKADVAVVTTDHAATETYEALTKDSNVSFGTTEPFSQAYARRIQRQEITLQEAPEELRERIEEIIDEDVFCAFSAEIHHGTINGVTEINGNYTRMQTVTLLIIADDGYRVPNQEEVSNKIKFIAKDDEDTTLDDYFETYCSYTTTEESTATLRLSITEDAAVVNTDILCISK